MKRNPVTLLLGSLIALLFILTQIVFIVRQGEVAVLTRLGRPVRAITEPGLYPRWPAPIERAYVYDARIRLAEGSLEESLTADGKNVLLGFYAGWRIADPVKFLERVGAEKPAEAGIDGLLRAAKSTAVGRYPFSALVNSDPALLKLGELEGVILKAVQEQAVSRYGIEVAFVGLRRIGLPETITESVFARMRAERQELADRYKAEGEGEAVRIKAEAESQRDTVLAQAEADAKRLRAEGDALAVKQYAVFEQQPELAMFLRKLDVMQDVLKERATVVLSAEMQPFDTLKEPRAIPAP